MHAAVTFIRSRTEWAHGTGRCRGLANDVAIRLIILQQSNHRGCGGSVVVAVAVAVVGGVVVFDVPSTTSTTAVADRSSITNRTVGDRRIVVIAADALVVVNVSPSTSPLRTLRSFWTSGVDSVWLLLLLFVMIRNTQMFPSIVLCCVVLCCVKL